MVRILEPDIFIRMVVLGMFTSVMLTRIWIKSDETWETEMQSQLRPWCIPQGPQKRDYLLRLELNWSKELGLCVYSYPVPPFQSASHRNYATSKNEMRSDREQTLNAQHFWFQREQDPTSDSSPPPKGCSTNCGSGKRVMQELKPFPLSCPKDSIGPSTTKRPEYTHKSKKRLWKYEIFLMLMESFILLLYKSTIHLQLYKKQFP